MHKLDHRSRPHLNLVSKSKHLIISVKTERGTFMIVHEIDFASSDVNLGQIKALSKAIPFKDLQAIYLSTIKRIGAENRQITIRTHSELVIHSYIAKTTRLTILPGFWIGKSCFDFFVPSIGGDLVNGKRSMRGLAIEIDGLVHQYEGKMKKDEHKITMLGKLGIGLLNIENCDIHSPAIAKLISSIQTMPRLSFRSRQSVLRKVYAHTLIVNKALYYGTKEVRK